MIDLNLYVALVDFFDGLEMEERFMGGGEAAFEWFSEQGLSRHDLEYVLLGVARITGHPKGEDWEQHNRRADLDRQVWTFHRAWVDRYGWEPTMELGERRQKRERRSQGQ